MDNSLWQDEAQLANMFLEEDSNRSSSESTSPGFNFNSAVNLKRNLTATFDRELSQTSIIEQMDMLNSSEPAANSYAIGYGDRSRASRPPLPTGAERVRPRKSKKNVAVYLRIRPLPSKMSVDDDSGSIEKLTSTIEVLEPSGKSNGSFPTTIRTYPPNLSNAYRVNINRTAHNASAYAKEFHFDRVMGPETSQENVYSTVAEPIIQDLLGARDKHTASSNRRRESALLFSYGITNAGKTHTVLGDINSTNQAKWGIIPRAISDIFQRNRIHSTPISTTTSMDQNVIDYKQKPTSDLYISFFEIYNENVYDLTPSSKQATQRDMKDVVPALKIRECRGQIFIRGLAKHKVGSVEHGVTLVKEAHNKRHTSSNNLNSDSSRSHFVCQMQIVPATQQAGSFLVRDFTSKTNTTNKISNADSLTGYSTDEEAVIHSRTTASTLWIVDLAGSERSKRTQVGITRQKESTKINNSLMTLMRCLNAMNENGKRGHGVSVMPFRESKLTHIFMGHLTSKSATRTAMIVNVNPSVEDFDETQHVLAYSRKAKLIEMNMEEYGAKRKQLFEEYDQNGRKKVKRQHFDDHRINGHSKKPKNTLLARMVKKFSPKRPHQKNLENDKIIEESIASTENFNRSEEIEKLKESLRAAEQQVQRLQNEKMDLLNELERKEDLIRAEVAVEMEERLRETRTKHNEKYEHLRSVMRHQTSKTDISVSMNRAGNQIEELMDKIDECETEMLRMSQEHKHEVAILMNAINELSKKEEVAGKEKAGDTLAIPTLKLASEKSNDEIICMRGDGTTNNDGRLARKTEQVHEDKSKVITQTTKFKKSRRPRAAFGDSTNHNSVGSRVFDLSIN